MKVNALKLVAVIFVVASIIALILNDFKYNNYVFVLNVIGILFFGYAILKNSKNS